ncbi:MAG: HSP90 family protein [Planctomycetota bacterium]
MPERFQVDLSGIIDLAANHMYTTPEVFVRELIQNAFDAITMRRRLDPSHEGRVRLELTSPTGSDDGESGSPVLCVHDNGIGLTVDEVHNLLSTVGGSSKREDAEKVAERIAEDKDSLLGRFGIGLLSCFMVTDEIVVVSRSARGNGTPVEWRGGTDGRYSVRELPDSTIQPGTSVYITAKDDESEHFEFETLVDHARDYAEMLPVRITVRAGDAETLISQEHVPWSIDASDEVALGDVCQTRLGFKPLDTFPIQTDAGEIKGYAFIRPDRGQPWFGGSRLYSHGMLVDQNAHGLLPRWATFIGCILNTRGLRLTASRESVHQDDDLRAAESEVSTAIRNRLARLLRNDRNRFASVMAVHDTEIRGLAVKEPEFFDLVADFLEFETTQGSIRFGEYRHEHERMLVARTAEQYRRIYPVAKVAGLRVFNAGYTYHEELLALAAQKHPELELVAFDSADMTETWPDPDAPERFASLLGVARGVLESRGCEPVVRRFAPAETPAFYALGLDAEFHDQLDRTKSMASQLWNEILDSLAPRPETLTPTRLCFNADSPLVRRVIEIEDLDLVKTAVEVMFVQALMSGQHPITTTDMALLHDGLDRLLSAAVVGRAGG